MNSLSGFQRHLRNTRTLAPLPDPVVYVFDKVRAGAQGTGREAERGERGKYYQRFVEEQELAEEEERRRRGHTRRRD